MSYQPCCEIIEMPWPFPGTNSFWMFQDRDVTDRQTDRYTDGQIHRRTDVFLLCVDQFFDQKMCNQPCCEIIDMPWPVSDTNSFSTILKAWRDRYTDGHKIGPLIIYRLVSLRSLAPAGGHIYPMLLTSQYLFNVAVEKFNIKDKVELY